MRAIESRQGLSPEVPELSENHTACFSCHRTSAGTTHSGHVRIQIDESDTGRVGNNMSCQGGGRVLGSKQDAKSGLLVYKKILRFIRSRYKHYCRSS